MAIKYKWLADRLKELIKKEEGLGKNKLPTEQELCRRYMVSRQTVRQALLLLQKEGLIEKRQGSGSYITGLSENASENQIEILITDDQEYIYPGILNDLHNTLSQNGFKAQIHVTAGRMDTERDILLSLLDHPPRGIIAEGCKTAFPSPNLDLYRRLKSEGTVLLFLYNYYPELEGSLYIKDDNIGGSRLLVRHLAEKGHTCIGGIFRSDDMQGIERFQGYLEAMHELKLPVCDDNLLWFHFRDIENLISKHDAGFLEAFIDSARKSCTAVICYNDIVAYYFIKALFLQGICLPDEMAVASFDDTYLSNSELLTITTLSHRPHEPGTKAAEMMIEKLKGLPVSSREIPWQLNEKNST